MKNATILFLIASFFGAYAQETAEPSLANLALSVKKANSLNSKALVVNESYSIENFFEELTAMELPEGSEDAIHVDFDWDVSNKSITILKIETREPDFFVLPEATGDEYNVDCANGDDSWSKTCDGKLSCGVLISDCLDEGACAEICTNQVVYAPQTRGIFLLGEVQ